MSFLFLNAQEVYVNFDNCLSVNEGALADPEITGSTSCDCGVDGESLFFEDPASSLNFDSTYTSIFQDDFTLSFNFMIRESQSGIIDIFSVSSECRVDSSLTIKYIPQESKVRIQMATNFELFIEVEGAINLDQCWHSLVFQRIGQNYNLFIDGQFSDTDFINGDIMIDPASTMQFSDSPCQAFGDSPFSGKIDEFKIYNRALSVEEIFDIHVPFDQILTRDTTIFSGISLKIRHTSSCADLVSWFPSKNVTQSTDLEPVIAPDETMLYRVNYDYGICAGQDSINIAVIDEDAVQCDNLLVPNAFTPNNDGLNDFIGISNAFIIEELRDFEIFDRWGEMVFSTSIKTDQWDGTLRNQKINSNVFLYKVNYTCKGEEFIKTGSFSILR
ncbi:T9SS type B sorting domain-containing protein [Portibacter lacus]|nr:T9SS type B sorting domain-containing protein [Portibacter lacus]